MRKSILSPNADHTSDRWLDLEELTHAELSSEDPSYQFENALHGGGRDGWRGVNAWPPGGSTDL